MALLLKSTLLVILGLLMLPSAAVEADSGAIEGKVTDQFGVVSSATLTARDLMSGKSVQVQADDTGRYRFEELRRGRYSLWVEAPGHDSMEIFRIIVERGAVTRQDVFLKRKTAKP